MRRRWKLAAVVLVVVATLTACGSSGPSASPGVAPATSAAPTTGAAATTTVPTLPPGGTSTPGSSVAPTTVPPTTAPPTTVPPTTVPPTTAAPTTVAPTTTRGVAPTTVAPRKVAPTTVKPTTVPPTTVKPTKGSPTTAKPAPASTVPSSTVPSHPAGGTLSVAASVPLPFAADNGSATVAAEGPDGAVFVADPAGGIVDVVDGNGPAAVAEHVSGTVDSLSADPSSLWAATATTVFRFDRRTGDLTAQWAVPAVGGTGSGAVPVRVVSAGGTVWVLVGAQGRTVDAYRIVPGSSAAPRLVVQTLGAAVGPNGTLYYERSDAHLAARTTAGATTVGPTLADRPDSEGGGVQDVGVVAGGRVWVDEPAGQGLDAEWRAYDTGTLAAGIGFGGNAGMELVGSHAGTLLLSAGALGGCPSTSSQVACVFRVALAPPVLRHPLAVGDSSALLGPDPAVVAVGPSGTDLEILRLS